MPPCRMLAAGLALALTTLGAACGGGGGSDDSSNPSSASYDPAKTTLHAAGLEVCSERQDVQTGGLKIDSNGLAAARGFFVAKDCNGAKETPNAVVVFQFTSADATQAGLAEIKRAYPRSETSQQGPLVIATTGPAAAANLTAITQALPASASSG